MQRAEKNPRGKTIKYKPPRVPLLYIILNFQAPNIAKRVFIFNSFFFETHRSNFFSNQTKKKIGIEISKKASQRANGKKIKPFHHNFPPISHFCARLNLCSGDFFFVVSDVDSVTCSDEIEGGAGNFFFFKLTRILCFL